MPFVGQKEDDVLDTDTLGLFDNLFRQPSDVVGPHRFLHVPRIQVQSPTPERGVYATKAQGHDSDSLSYDSLGKGVGEAHHAAL
jgi:hypothetical protein